MSPVDKKLKEFMLDNFDFPTLKKIGVFPKEMKLNDYEGQAKRICLIFTLESVYDYPEIGKGTRYHLSEPIEPDKPLTIRRYQPFVRTMGETGEPGKILPFTKKKEERQ